MANDLFGIVGSVVAGAYEVEAVVAEGGFAVVYRAQHKGFGAPVALKCLKLGRKFAQDRQQEFLAQFRAEAALLFQLSSRIPTVVRPLHMDALTTTNGTFVPYMALEWLEGETLAAIIRKRADDGRPAPSLKKLVRLLGPVATALERAHNFTAADGSSVSIVHCDVKPENIFVASVAGEQSIKILDFGVAKAQSVASQVAGRGASGSSAVHSFTPAYAAPEQWDPEKYGETGPWTDVWGLALTLVEALAGRPIIDGDVGAMMGAALDPIARPTPLNNDVEVPPEVEAVFERALALDPRDRPPHAGAFWDELLVALRMKEGRARDARREVGAVLREERVEIAKPKVQVRRRIDKLRLAPASGQPFPPRELAPKRNRLTIDDPFDMDDAPSQSDVLSVPSAPVLEAQIPSLPPAHLAPIGPGELPPAPERLASPGRVSPAVGTPGELPPAPERLASAGVLEADFPSIPPATPAELEAALPSDPPPRPGQPHLPGAERLELDIPSKPPPARERKSFELEAPLPSTPEASPGLASRRDDDLEASLRPPSQDPIAVPAFGGEIEISAETPSFRVDLKSDLPPRIAAPPRVALVREPRPLPRAERPSSTPMPQRGYGLVALGVGAIVAAIGVALADQRLRGEDGTAGFMVGPLSPTALAAMLLGTGVVVLLVRFLPRDR